MICVMLTISLLTGQQEQRRKNGVRHDTTTLKWREYGIASEFTRRDRALLLACGLQFAHANSDPHTIVFGVAPGRTAIW